MSTIHPRTATFPAAPPRSIAPPQTRRKPFVTNPPQDSRHISLKLPLIVLGAVIVVAFCSLVIASLFGGPQYTVSQSIQESYIEIFGQTDYVLRVSVAGPARRIAVLVTNPQGKTITKVIEKEDLMDNKQDICFSFSSMQKGDYGITLKDFDTERIVGQQSFVIANDLMRKQTQGLAGPQPPEPPGRR